MKSKDVFSFAFGAVRLRKMRAGLTILGIVIGIAAIVALTSITTGLQVTITSELGAGFSSDTVTVSTQSFGMFGGGSSDFTLLVNDTDTINEIDGVAFAAAQPNVARGHYGDIEVNFIGFDDLIQNKMATPRAKDKGDVEELTGN